MGLFSFGKKKEDQADINWVILKEEEQLIELVKESHEKPVILLKHSTRCSISSMALSRLQNYWDIAEETATPVYLDLIAYRSISNKIESTFGVMHQSPQILIIKNGKCTYNTSHNQISVDAIKSNL